MFSSSSPHTQFQFSSFSLCLILKFKKIPHVRNVSWCNDQSMWSGWPWDNPLRLACSRHQSDISQTLHDNNSVELYPFLTVLMTLIWFQGHSDSRKVRLKLIFLTNMKKCECLKIGVGATVQMAWTSRLAASQQWQRTLTLWFSWTLCHHGNTLHNGST